MLTTAFLFVMVISFCYSYKVLYRKKRNCSVMKSHHLHTPLCRKFGPHSVNVAHYASLIRT
ncbi:DUF6783 domain-containing protein [Lachnospiraceae bacterium 45-P1]